jgi:hypothetical protein
LDIGVLGYIGIVWPKEHSPEVVTLTRGTPCIWWPYDQSWRKIYILYLCPPLSPNFSFNRKGCESVVHVTQVECGLASLQLTFLPILFWLANEKAIMRNKTRCALNKYNVSHCRWTSHASLCLTVLLRVIIPSTKAGLYVVLPTCSSSFRRGGNKSKLCVISDFRREVERSALSWGITQKTADLMYTLLLIRFSNLDKFTGRIQRGDCFWWPVSESNNNLRIRV